MIPYCPFDSDDFQLVVAFFIILYLIIQIDLISLQKEGINH